MSFKPSFTNPSCSSVPPFPAVPEESPFSCSSESIPFPRQRAHSPKSPLLQALIDLGIVDEIGRLRPDYPGSHELLPLGGTQLEKFFELRNKRLKATPFDKELSVQEWLIFFEEQFLAEQNRLVGGRVWNICDFDYCCEMLKQLGITNPKTLIEQEIAYELQQQSPDSDFRAYVPQNHRFYFETIIVREIIEKLMRLLTPEERQGLHQDPTKSLEKQITESSFSKPLRMPKDGSNSIPISSKENVDFVLYNELRTDYLMSSHALQIPCDVLKQSTLPSGYSVAPTAPKGLSPLQCFLDRLLKRVMFHPSLDVKAWVTVIYRMAVNNYRVKEGAVWNSLKDYSFEITETPSLGELLGQYVIDCAKSHPSKNPQGPFICAIHIIALLGDRLEPGEAEKIIKKVLEANPSGKPTMLHELFSRPIPSPLSIPTSILNLSALLWEMMSLHPITPEQPSCSYSRYDELDSYHLAFPSEGGIPLHIQLKANPVDAYATLISQLSQVDADSQWHPLICRTLLSRPLEINPASRLVKGCTELNLSSLLQSIKKNLSLQNPFFATLHFLLLNAIHAADPTEETELLILEQLPLVLESCKDGAIRANILQTASNILDPRYREAIQQLQDKINSSPGTSLHHAWITALVSSKEEWVQVKLLKLFPKFEQRLKKGECQKAFTSIWRTILQSSPKRAIKLLNTCIHFAPEGDLFYFTAYCQTIHYLLQQGEQSLLTSHLLPFADHLIRFCHTTKTDVQTTKIREEALFYVLNALLDQGHLEKARTLFRLVGQEHFVYAILEKYWSTLLQKFIQLSSWSSSPVIALTQSAIKQGVFTPQFASFCLMRIELHRLLEKNDIHGAIKTLVRLLQEHSEELHRCDKNEPIMLIWHKLETASRSISTQISLIQNSAIQAAFPQFCSEKHDVLLERLPQTAPLIPETAQAFLQLSLRRYFPEISRERREEYCSKLVPLLRCALPRSGSLDRQFIKDVAHHFPALLEAAKNDSGIQTRLVKELHNIGIPLDMARDQKHQVIQALCMEIRGNRADGSTLKTLLTILQRLHTTLQIALPPDDVIRLCRHSFENQQLDNGCYWLKLLLSGTAELPEPMRVLVAERFPGWLLLLHGDKKYRAVSELLSFSRPLRVPMAHLRDLFTEPFIHSQLDSLLDYFLKFPITPAQEPAITGALITALQRAMKPDDVFFSKAVTFLYQEKVSDAYLWVCFYGELPKIKGKKILRFAFDILRKAISEGLLENNSTFKETCWLHATSPLRMVSKKQALEWLKDDSELKKVYGNSNGELSPTFFTAYCALFDLLLRDKETKPSLQFLEIVLEAQKRLYSYFPEASFDGKKWELDLKLFGFFKGHFTTASYDAFVGALSHRLFQLNDTQLYVYQLFPLLIGLTNVKLDSNALGDSTVTFLANIISLYSSRLWIFKYFSACYDPSNAAKSETIRYYILFCIEEFAKNNSGQDFKKQLCAFLPSFIAAAGQQDAIFVLQLITHPAVVNVFSETESDHISFLELWKQFFEKYIENNLQNIDHYIALLKPFFLRMPTKIQTFTVKLLSHIVINNLKSPTDITEAIKKLSQISLIVNDKSTNINNYFDRVYSILCQLNNPISASSITLRLYIGYILILSIIHNRKNIDLQIIEKIITLFDYYVYEFDGITDDRDRDLHLEYWGNLQAALQNSIESLRAQSSVSANVYPLHLDIIRKTPSSSPRHYEVVEMRNMAIFKRMAVSRSHVVMGRYLNNLDIMIKDPACSLPYIYPVILPLLENLQINPHIKCSGISIREKVYNLIKLLFMRVKTEKCEETIAKRAEIAGKFIEVMIHNGELATTITQKKSAALDTARILKKFYELGVFDHNLQEYLNLCERVFQLYPPERGSADDIDITDFVEDRCGKMYCALILIDHIGPRYKGFNKQMPASTDPKIEDFIKKTIDPFLTTFTTKKSIVGATSRITAENWASQFNRSFTLHRIFKTILQNHPNAANPAIASSSSQQKPEPQSKKRKIRKLTKAQ